MENKEYTPSEYFEYIKSKREKVTDKELKDFYNNCLILINKYKITGQLNALKKLIFQTEIIEKERELVKTGIDTFVYKDDIEDYIDNISKNVVKIIDIENYERDIPDEIVEVVDKTKHLFDQLYVVFTDYTGKIEKQVQKTRRDKDPILFGTFQDKKNRVIIDRFYYLGDWIDEYCDLTLDKMVKETAEKTNKKMVKNIYTPQQLKELKEQLNQLHESDNNRFLIDNNKNKSNFFDKIRSALR